MKSHLDEIIQNYLFDNDITWSFIHEKIKMRAFISVEQKEYYEKRINALRTSLISLLEKYGEEMLDIQLPRIPDDITDRRYSMGLVQGFNATQEKARTKLKEIITSLK